MAGVVSNSLKIMTEPVLALLFQQSPVTVRQISGRHNPECPERSPVCAGSVSSTTCVVPEALGVCPGMHIGGDLKAVVPPRIPFLLSHDLIGPGELDLYHGRLSWSGRCRTHHAERSKFAGVADRQIGFRYRDVFIAESDVRSEAERCCPAGLRT